MQFAMVNISPTTTYHHLQIFSQQRFCCANHKKKWETFLSNTSGKFIYHNHPTHTEQSSQTNKFKRIEERKYRSAKYLSLWVTTMDISSHWYQSTWTLTASDWHSPNVGPDVHSVWTDYSCMTYRATEIKSKCAAVSRLGTQESEKKGNTQQKQVRGNHTSVTEQK